MERRLYRSQDDRIIAGVCGGLAKYFDIDPTIVRIITVLLAFFSAGGVIVAYIILAIVIPLEKSRAAEPREVVQENVEELKKTAGELGREIRSIFTEEAKSEEETARLRHRRRNLFGIILIALGIIFLLGSFSMFWWFSWKYLWPLIIITIGVLIIIVARRR